MDAEWPDTSSNEDEDENQNPIRIQNQIEDGGSRGGSRSGGFMDDRKRVGFTAAVMEVTVGMFRDRIEGCGLAGSLTGREEPPIPRDAAFYGILHCKTLLVY